MKIKHFSGYGTVEAKKLGVSYYEYKTKVAVGVMIKGNHEQGLKRPYKDEYLVANWLKRFMPKGFKMFDYQATCLNNDSDGIEYAYYTLYGKEAQV